MSNNAIFFIFETKNIKITNLLVYKTRELIELVIKLLFRVIKLKILEMLLRFSKVVSVHSE